MTWGLTSTFPGWHLLNPQYQAYGSMDRVVTDSINYYNPGLLEEYAFRSNIVLVNQDSYAHVFGASNVEGIKEWWNSRAGFERQLTKAIAAEPGKFDEELAEVDAFCDSTGFTDEALKEFNEKYIEANKDKLDAAGVVY